MRVNFSPEEAGEIENQLRCPDGEKGVEVGYTMNKLNISMTMSTIHTLQIEDNLNILEIGHGNFRHLVEILSKPERSEANKSAPF